MIIPNNLTPLPVGPRGEESADVPASYEDFVTAGDVRNVLLGGRAELPVECLPADDFDSFAGRADVPLPPGSPFHSRLRQEPQELRVPDMLLEPRTIHPAFDVIPPSTRRATPPRAQGAVDCEASFGSPRLTDRWWVIGMGLAAAAVLFSGTLVDFISREAVRRSLSQASASPEVFRAAAPAATPQATDAAKQSLATTANPDEEE